MMYFISMLLILIFDQHQVCNYVPPVQASLALGIGQPPGCLSCDSVPAGMNVDLQTRRHCLCKSFVDFLI